MQAFFQAYGRTLLDPHQRVMEDRGMHLTNGACNQWHKLHVRQDIPFKIDAGRSFHQFQTTSSQVEDAAFRDVIDGLLTLESFETAEGDLLHPADELFSCPLLYNVQPPILDGNL